VFSYTVDDQQDKVVRHLTISVPGSGLPNPYMVKAIARIFGFTGEEREGEMFPAGWVVGPKRAGAIDDECIVVGQVIEGLRP